MSLFAVQLDKATPEKLPYTFDFSSWDALASDTISSATVVGSPAGLTIGAVTVDGTGKKVLTTISAGTVNTTYRVTIQATTTAGNILDGYVDLTVSVP